MTIVWIEKSRDADWFASLSRRRQRAYLRDHPHSKYAHAPAPEVRRAPARSAPAKPSRPRRVITTANDLKRVNTDYPEDARERANLADAWNRHFHHARPHEYGSHVLHGIGHDGVTHVAEGPKKGVTVTSSALDHRGNVLFDAVRLFHHDPKQGLVATHDRFHVSSQQQGHGLAKKFLRNSMREYDRAGVKRVDLYANVNVGGYAWAKYGFYPTQKEWPKIRNRIATRFEKIRKQVPQHLHEHVHKALASNNPRAIWNLADMSEPVHARSQIVHTRPVTHTLGKHLLLNQDWDGEMHTNDEEARQRFHAYVGK